MTLRDQMPQTAAFIDACREAFGAAEVDEAIRRGMRGEEGFHAIEAGIEIGTPLAAGTLDVQLFGPDRTIKSKDDERPAQMTVGSARSRSGRSQKRRRK